MGMHGKGKEDTFRRSDEEGETWWKDVTASIRNDECDFLFQLLICNIIRVITLLIFLCACAYVCRSAWMIACFRQIVACCCAECYAETAVYTSVTQWSMDSPKRCSASHWTSSPLQVQPIAKHTAPPRVKHSPQIRSYGTETSCSWSIIPT